MSAETRAPTFNEVHQAARGRWAEILPALGVPTEVLTGRHGPCPGCGGRDRFRWDDRDGRGTWICGGGGSPVAGDGFELLGHALGMSKAEALRAVAQHLGIRGDAASAARLAEIRARRERERVEAAVWHELLVLADVVGARVTERKFAKDQKFRTVRPGWRPMPDAHWDRERLAARRLQAGLARLYP